MVGRELHSGALGHLETSMYLLFKFVLSAVIVVAVSEIARRSTLFGALVASLPLTSVLAMLWLYHESGDAARVATLSGEIFWLVLPSLLLFLVLPWMIRRGVHFYVALSIAIACTVVGYGILSLGLLRFGLRT
jgi:uncharacterized membrane protein (GlpM family)